jgi:hypothetical protein
MKNILPALAMVAVIGAAYTLSGEHVGAESELQAVRSISVSGMAERKIVPDEAHLRVNLNSMNLKMATAKAEHDEKLKKLLSITAEAGIDERKVRSESSTIQPIYDYVHDPKTSQNNRIFKGYRVQTQIDVTVDDTDKLGALMDQITNAGFEQGANTEWGDLLSLNYQIAEPDKKRDELLAEAISNARAKAERMAQAADAKLGPVYQINEGSAPSFRRPVPMPMMMMAKAADAGMNEAAYAPPAGEQNVQATVNVVFELK